MRTYSMQPTLFRTREERILERWALLPAALLVIILGASVYWYSSFFESVLGNTKQAEAHVIFPSASGDTALTPSGQL